MKVSYNRLWKLLIDKGMKKANCGKQSVQVKALLQSSARTKMLRCPSC